MIYSLSFTHPHVITDLYNWNIKAILKNEMELRGMLVTRKPYRFGMK